jgi:hypothetical protein
MVHPKNILSLRAQINSSFLIPQLIKESKHQYVRHASAGHSGYKWYNNRTNGPKPNAASEAEKDVDMEEIDKFHEAGEIGDDDDFADYNEDGTLAAIKGAKRKALRERLVETGKESV